MPRILLLHTNQEYGNMLADTVSSHVPDFDATVISRVSVLERLEALATEQYDIVQADELLVNGILASGASLLRNVPLVSAVRGWADYTNAHGQYGRIQDATIRARTRMSLRQSSATIFLSEKTRTEFTDCYDVAEPRVVGRPIDADRYADGTLASRGSFDLLTVTNLRYEEKYRGVITILRALKSPFAAEPDLRFRIAAGGQYLPELRSFLDSYEYANRVDILGFVDRIEDEFATADAFVYVSFLDAYPTVVLEAQAAGLPVVGGDAVGVPAVVGDAGLLCDPTPQGVRSAIERVVSDESYRESLAERSREKMTDYNQMCAAGHANVWRRVLDG